MQQVYEVSQINEYLKCRFEEDEFLSDLLIRGEISNYFAVRRQLGHTPRYSTEYSSRTNPAV